MDDDRYSWRKYCGAGYKYNVYPENYETPDEYEADLAHAIHEKGEESKFAPKSQNTARNTGDNK